MPASSFQQSTLVEMLRRCCCPVPLRTSGKFAYFVLTASWRTCHQDGSLQKRDRGFRPEPCKVAVISRVGGTPELQVCLEKDTPTLFWGRGIAIAAESGPEHREAEAPACLFI
jgi:hypothetical protein